MNFEKNLLSQGQAFFTQDEFNKTLGEAKAEIMAVAIQTTKQAMFMERELCAELVMQLADEEDEGEVSTALRSAANQIINRTLPKAP